MIKFCTMSRIKHFTIPSLLTYFYPHPSPPGDSSDQSNRICIRNLYDTGEPLLLDGAYLPFFSHTYQQKALQLKYENPLSPELVSDKEYLPLLNTRLYTLLLKSWFRRLPTNEAENSPCSLIRFTHDIPEQIPDDIMAAPPFRLPPLSALARYKQMVKKNIYELKLLHELTPDTPESLSFFVHFPHWHGLMNASLEKMLEAKIWQEKQRIFNEISQLFSVKVLSENGHYFLKITIPQQLTPSSIRLLYPRWMRTSPYPFLLDKHRQPISFHLRLFNNDLLEPTGKQRLCNRYEIISCQSLQDVVYFGFLPDTSKKSRVFSFPRQSRSPHFQTDELYWQADQSFPCLVGFHQKQSLLKIGPLTWQPCRELGDSTGKLRYLVNTRFRVLENRGNAFLKSWHLCQTMRFPIQKVHNQHLTPTSPVRSTFFHHWKWIKDGESGISLYTVSFENRLLNGFSGLFLGADNIQLYENHPFSQQEKSPSYFLTTGFSVPVDESRSLFCDFPFPVILQPAIYKKQKGFIFPLLQTAELIDWRWTGHPATLYQPKMYLPGNDRNKVYSYTFLIYISPQKKKHAWFQQYTWNLPDPWKWGKRSDVKG